MPATSYTYSIQADFPNHVVATDRLTQEIRFSTITIAIDFINTSGDACDIWFKDVLPAGDQTTLDGLVAVHGGVSLVSTPAAFTGPVSFVIDGYTTTVSTSFAAIRGTTYAEPSSAAQRSVSSSSASDTSAGVGARTVRIRYFDNTLNGPFSEDIVLNGTAPVNTTATNIRFIESMCVLTCGSSSGNVGDVTLYGSTAGGGGVVGSIASGDNQTNWCHHYVASGYAVRLVDATGTLKAMYGGRVDLRKRYPLSSNVPEETLMTLFRIPPGGQERTTYDAPIEVVGPSQIVLYARPDNAASADWTAGFTYFEASSS